MEGKVWSVKCQGWSVECRVSSLGCRVPKPTPISVIEGSLEVKLPTVWTNQKQRWEESEKRREEKRRRKKIKKEKVSEERRSRCAKRQESREKLRFSNDLWLRRVDK